MSYIAWLVVFVVFAALELVSLGLTCIWFAIGAALLGANWIVQAVVFLVVTMVVLIFIRPFAIKYVNNKAEKTNVESMAGKQGKVVVEIDNINAKGMIKVDGMEWTARSVDGEIIPKDSLVTVVSVEGVKAMVRKAEYTRR